MRDIARMQNAITFSIVGSGGDGAVVAGDLIAMACAARGLHVMKTEAYGPQIRGGESSSTVRIGATRIFAPEETNDALIVFRFADFARFRSEMALSENCIVLHEPDDPPPPEIAAYRCIAVPFGELAREKNMVAIGVLAKMFGLPFDALQAAVRQRFARKGAAVIEGNMVALQRGFDAPHPPFGHLLPARGEKGQLLMSGN